MARRIKVDMTGVESYNKASEGQHVVKIYSIDEKQSQGGNDMLQCCFEVTRGQDKGCRVYETYPLIENALWKLKGMLQAVGMKAEGKISLDLDKLIGKQLIIEVVWEEYNGQDRARVSECRKLSSLAEEDSEEDEDFEEPEDEEEEEQEEPKKKPAKKTTAKKKTTPKKKAPEPEEDDEEDWDEDDEEEEPPKKKKAPAKKKTTAKKAPAKKKAPEPEEDDDEEDWDEDDEEDWEEA